jgi:hypothetical protein
MEKQTRHTGVKLRSRTYFRSRKVARYGIQSQDGHAIVAVAQQGGGFAAWGILFFSLPIFVKWAGVVFTKWTGAIMYIDNLMERG